jgi:hypothetical protein
MDLNRDELRRQLRDLDRAHQATEADQRALTSALFEDIPADQRAGVLLGGVDRRGFFRMGGLAVAATAVLAACRDTEPKAQLPVSGSTPGYKPLKDKPITDVVLLRTATSLEWSVVDAYMKLLDNGYIEDPALADLCKVFADHHRAHAAVFGAATTAAGGTACTQLNAKITGYLIDPLISLVRDSGPGRAEDAKALAHAVENLAAATYQSVVPIFTQPALRQAAMSVGAVEAKHAALLAAILNPTQLTTVPTSAAPTTTVAGAAPTAITANSIIAVPGAFGSLAPIPLTLGPANENGVRKTTNIETPSLNSFSYEDEAC